MVENELIKKFKPRYNILLKDDKSFPHLMIDVGSVFPACASIAVPGRTRINISGRLQA